MYLFIQRANINKVFVSFFQARTMYFMCGQLITINVQTILGQSNKFVIAYIITVIRSKIAGKFLL